MTAADDERTVDARIASLALKPARGTLELAATIRPETSALKVDTSQVATAPTIAADGVADAIEELPRVSIEAPSIATGAVIGDLALVSTLGEGGMGRVHLARQRSLDRDVAVKTLKDGASNEIAISLLREARITGSLEHPGVVPVHAIGVDSHGQPLIVMKRVEGAELGELLADASHPLWSGRQGRNVDLLGAQLDIVIQVCRTLEFAHARGVIHRDIKPANVMVGQYGEVYLLDWGIATKKRETDPRLVGTPGYMAPEMFLGGPVDERTDVYLLGAMLHHVLTGRLRHAGDDLQAVAYSALESIAVVYGPDVPSQLADLCNRATSRAPSDRPRSAAELRESLLDFLQHRAALVLSATARERLTRFRDLVAAAPPESPPADLAAAYRLLTEARFGFTQCLASYPGHEDATVGTRESIAALVDLELRQEHAESAAAMLIELDVADPGLAARIAELRAKNEARRLEAARLEALGRDVDPTIGLAQRIILVASSVLVSLVIGAVVLSKAADEQNPWVSVAMVAVMILLMAVAMFALKKWAFQSAFNRRLGAFFFLALGFWLVDRVGCALTGGPVAGSFVVDLWIMAATFSTGAVAVERRLAISAVPFALGALAVRAWPDRMSLWFTLAMFAGMASLVMSLIAQSRRTRSKAS